MSEVLKRRMRCAVYTRKSTDEGLDQEYNSIDAQRDAGHAYIASQRAEGWIPVADDYDDPAFSGGNMERPALQRMMADIEAGKIDVVVIYKIDRLTRSLADFSKMVEVFERYGVSFVSVTQQFNTTTSMGRLMLNILLSFAQFEREVTGWPRLCAVNYSEYIARVRVENMINANDASVPAGYTRWHGKHLLQLVAECPIVPMID